MLKLGLFLNDMTLSERNYCFMEQLNKIAYSKMDCRIFYRNLTATCVNLKCSIMPSSELFNFNNGVIITTNIETTIMAAKAPISSKVIFYVDDIEWMRQGKQNYFLNLQAYSNKYVTLISKSNQYADCLNNYCGRKPPVVTGYDIEEILKYGYFQNSTNVPK